MPGILARAARVGSRPTGRSRSSPDRGWRVRGLAALLAAVLVAALPVHADDRDGRADAPGPGAPALANTFSGDEAYRHLVHLAETIGPRPAGSERETAAATYLATELERLGYQTEIQPFTIQSYEERSAVLAPLAPAGEPIDTTALLYSLGGEAAGELIDAGLARRGDWPGGSLAGRVALIERGDVTFSDKVAHVAEAGAVAAIIFNDRDGAFTGNLRSPSAIPALTLPRADGIALRERLARGPVRVAVSVDAEVTTRQSHNVIATRPGTRPGAIVVGGHFDSVPEAPGANDNASGTATVLELARYYAPRIYPYTLHFAAFGAEEIGLRGSRHYVDALPEEARSSILAMINLDMVGVGDQQRITGTGELVDLARGVADVLALPDSTVSGSSPGGSSDHASFDRTGIPVLFIHRGSDPNYHSPRDRAQYVDPAALALAGQLAIATLERLAAETR